MSADPYSDGVRALFADTAHCGDLPGGVAGSADARGVRIRMMAMLDGSSLATIRYRAFGCPHVIAACEHFCRSFEGSGAGELQNFSVAGIMRDLSVPVEKTGRILVLEDAVRVLAENMSGGLASKTQ